MLNKKGNGGSLNGKNTSLDPVLKVSYFADFYKIYDSLPKALPGPLKGAIQMRSNEVQPYY